MSPPTAHSAHTQEETIPGHWQLWGAGNSGTNPLKPTVHPYTKHTHTHHSYSNEGTYSFLTLPHTSQCRAALKGGEGTHLGIQWPVQMQGYRGISSSLSSHKIMHRHTTELIHTVTQSTGHPRSVSDTTFKDTRGVLVVHLEASLPLRNAQLHVDTQPAMSVCFILKHTRLRHNFRYCDTLGPHTAQEHG